MEILSFGRTIRRVGFVALLAGPLLSSGAETRADSVTPDPIEGTWTGQVSAPDGRTAEVGFAFKRGKGRSLDLVFHMPDMFTYRADLPQTVEARPDGYYFIALLDTKLHREGDRLTGTFGLSQLPLALQRGGSFEPEPAPPHHPAAPVPLWSRSLGSSTWGTPVVRDDIIYVGTQDGRFHAARASDGNEVWTWNGTNRIDGRAVVTSDRVYFVDGKVDLVALNRIDGTLCWRCPLHETSPASPPADDNPTFNRRTATPLVIDHAVYCGSSDGGLYAVDSTTGRILWRYDAKSPIFSGISQFDPDILSFGCMDGSVVEFNYRTRQETGRMKTARGVVTTPLLAAGKVIVGSRDYLLYGFNACDGSVAWKYSYWFSWVESTPQLVDGVLYVGASDFRRVTALNPADGRAFWSTDVRGIDWGSPLVTADTIFIGTVAQNVPGTLIHHTGGIVALDRKTGAVKWQLLSPVPPENSFGGYAGSLALAGDKVIAIGYEGVLIAFPVKS